MTGLTTVEKAKALYCNTMNVTFSEGAYKSSGIREKKA